MPKPSTTSVNQLATRQDDGVGTVYIYGIVGQMPEWWLPKEDQTVEEISAMTLVEALNELAEDNDVINIRINSPGGSMYEGEAMVNALRNCKAEIHTWNDGMAASMASTLWLAGDVRHMAKNAKLMLHAPLAGAYGHAPDLREAADLLDKWAEASAIGIAETTEMSAEEVTSQFFDGKDHWLTYTDVDELGMISVADNYEVAKGAPGDQVEQISYHKLIQQFEATPPKERTPSAFQRIRQAFAPPVQQVITPEKPEPVTPQELRDAIANGDITVDQLGEIHQELTAPEPDPAADLKETITMAVTAAVKPLNAEIERLGKELTQLAATPGAQPAGVTAGSDPGSAPGATPTAVDAKQFANYAEGHQNPFKNPNAQVADDWKA